MATISRGTTGFAGSLNPDVIDQVIRQQLVGNFSMANFSTEAFGGRPEGDEYVFPIVSSDAASELAAGGTVTDAAETYSDMRISLSTWEISKVYTWDMISSIGGSFLPQLIENSYKQLIKQVETQMIKSLTQNEDVTNYAHISGQANMTFEHVAYALKAMREDDFDDTSDLHMMVTPEGERLLRAEAEISQYNTTGFSGAFENADYGRKILGFMPHVSNRLWNPASAITYAVDDASGFNDSVTTFGYDTNSVADTHPKPGDILLIDSEKIYVLAVTITDADQGVIDNCIRGFGGTTAASHADDAAITVVSGYTNLAWSKSCVKHVFTPQETYAWTGYDEKVEIMVPGTGIKFYLLREKVSAKGGGSYRYTALSRFGVAPYQPAGIVRIPTIL